MIASRTERVLGYLLLSVAVIVTVLPLVSMFSAALQPADRNPTGHLAFGTGIHGCPGAQLARMEGQAVLREIVANIDRIDVLAPPAWTTNANLRGLTRLQVAVTPRVTAPRLSPVR